MRTHAIALTIVLAVAGASSLWAQSLADAAKEEQARRAKVQAETGKSLVIDNEKLLEYRDIALNGDVFTVGGSPVSSVPEQDSSSYEQEDADVSAVDADEEAAAAAAAREALSEASPAEEAVVPSEEAPIEGAEGTTEGGGEPNVIMQRGTGRGRERGGPPERER